MNNDELIYNQRNVIEQSLKLDDDLNYLLRFYVKKISNRIVDCLSDNRFKLSESQITNYIEDEIVDTLKNINRNRYKKYQEDIQDITREIPSLYQRLYSNKDSKKARESLVDHFDNSLDCRCNFDDQMQDLTLTILKKLEVPSYDNIAHDIKRIMTRSFDEYADEYKQLLVSNKRKLLSLEDNIIMEYTSKTMPVDNIERIRECVTLAGFELVKTGDKYYAQNGKISLEVNYDSNNQKYIIGNRFELYNDSNNMSYKDNYINQELIAGLNKLMLIDHATSQIINITISDNGLVGTINDNETDLSTVINTMNDLCPNSKNYLDYLITKYAISINKDLDTVKEEIFTKKEPIKEENELDNIPSIEEINQSNPFLDPPIVNEPEPLQLDNITVENLLEYAKNNNKTVEEVLSDLVQRATNVDVIKKEEPPRKRRVDRLREKEGNIEGITKTDIPNLNENKKVERKRRMDRYHNKVGSINGSNQIDLEELINDSPFSL